LHIRWLGGVVVLTASDLYSTGCESCTTGLVGYLEVLPYAGGQTISVCNR